MRGEIGEIILHRSKRFVFNANSTCGYIAFCSPDIHKWDLVLNTSLANNEHCSKTGVIISIVFGVVMSLMILFGNFMILYIMTSSNKFRNAQGILKASLAVYDFLVGAIIIPSTLCNQIRIMLLPLNESYLSYLSQHQPSSTSILFGWLFSFSITGSLFSLLVLTLDRLMAVNWPLKYSQSRLLARKRAMKAVVVVCLLSLILSSLATGDKQRFYYSLDYMTLAFMLEIKINSSNSPPDTYHGIFFLICVFVVPYVCVVVVTIITWLLLWRDKRKIRTEKINMNLINISSRHSVISSSMLNTVSEEVTKISNVSGKGVLTSDLRIKKQNRKKKFFKITRKKLKRKELERVTKVIFIMVATFSLCVMPFVVAQAENITPYPGELQYLQKYGTYGQHTCNPIVYLVVLNLLYLNSLCNFIIYNLRNETFREEVKRLLPLRSSWFANICKIKSTRTNSSVTFAAT